jgi:arsenate reductase-like glutaredoxin family protein
MAIIKSPNSKYNGVSASLPFVNGEAKTENKWLIEWFKNRGYEVTEEEIPQEPPLDPETNPLDEMTHDELDAFAKQKEVPDEDYPKSGKKEEKAAAIKEFLAGE